MKIIVKTHFRVAQSLGVGVSLDEVDSVSPYISPLFITPIPRALIVKTPLRDLLNPNSKDWR